MSNRSPDQVSANNHALWPLAGIKAMGRYRALLVVAIAGLLLLIRMPTFAQGPDGEPGPVGAVAPSRAMVAPNQAMGEEGCTNPAAVCIPDGAASVIFTFTGSTQCQWSYGIDWGDGSPRESFTYSGPGQHIVNHQYDEPGVYRATITGSGSPSGCVFTGNTILYEVPCSMAEEDFGALPRFEFGPYTVLDWRALTYSAEFNAAYSVGWRLCPNASTKASFAELRFPLEEGGEAGAITAGATGVKLSSIYPIEVQGDDMATEYGFEPDPYFEIEWSRSENTRGQALALQMESAFNAHWTVYPNQVALMTVCVAAVASGGAAIASLSSGSGGAVVLQSLAAWIRQMGTRYPGVLPVPGVALTEAGTTLDPSGATEATLEDMALVFGAPFLETATVTTLQIDEGEREPGDRISYSGAGFAADGDVLLLLVDTNDGETFVMEEVVANDAGNIGGTIDLPDDAGEGRWLIVAIDLQAMRLSLQAFADSDGDGETLVFPVAANSIVIAARSYLPSIHSG